MSSLMNTPPPRAVFFPDQLTVSFTPTETGLHTVEVTFNGCHVSGSPFHVRVGDMSGTKEPGLVTAYGSGLDSGTTGGSGRNHVK